MKTATKYMVMVIFSVCVLMRNVNAGVYIYTEDSGTINLSNVPSDQRYEVFIFDQEDGVLASTTVKKEVSSLINKFRYDKFIDDAAKAYGLNSALIHAVILVESRYNSKAVSKKGAMGLMQLMPETAKRYGVIDGFDPAQNIAGGAKYLRDLLGLFDNNIDLTLAAYNSGENNVIKYGNHIPPFRETKIYVSKVLGFYNKYNGGK